MIANNKIRFNLPNTQNEDQLPEIKFITKELSSSIKKKYDHESIKKLHKIILSIIAFVTIFIIVIVIFYQSENYHHGVWKAELTNDERNAGIIESIYTISDESIRLTSKSNVDGIESTITIKYVVKLLDKKRAAIIFRIDGLELIETQVFIPLNLCFNNKFECDKLQNKFQKDITDSIDKQNLNYKGKLLRLIPDKDKLKFIILGETEVILSKK